MNIKKELLVLISGFLIILLVIVGVSYAYFTASMAGEESTTITVKGGKMLITYDGGDDIVISNILPNDNPATTKTFTVAGFNNTEIEMAYKLSLVVESNTFTEEALKYKLISTNTDNNGNVVPSITELQKIPSGTSTIELGIGSFEVPTDENKTHTYNLEIYFPHNDDDNQNVDQGKEIKAYILTENYIDPCTGKNCLGKLILAQGGGIEEIVANGTPNFNVISEISELYAAEDEYGTSYYYRGQKNQLNNNLIWGGFQWKIVRINGDGSIRLVYNGTEAQFTTNGIVNDTGEDTQIETSSYSSAYNDAKYVGYMYGGVKEAASTERHGLVSAAATYNETSNDIKDMIDNWYRTNILNKTFESQVVNNLFCNDRQLADEVGGTNSGKGYGNDEIYYAPYHRFHTNNAPTLKCALKNDSFTTSADTVVGNGALTYPVGLLTADEIVMAGSVLSEENSTNYLYTNQAWWLMSPAYMEESTTYVWSVTSYGNIYYNYVYNAFGSRPSISITYNTTVSGTGTASDPFVAS